MQGVHMHTSAGKLKGLVSTAPLMQNLNTFQENRGKPADMRDVRQSNAELVWAEKVKCTLKTRLLLRIERELS